MQGSGHCWQSSSIGCMSEEESYDSSSNEVQLLAPVQLPETRLPDFLVWEICSQPLQLVPQSGAPDWSRDQAQVCLISKQLHTDNYTKDGMMYNRIQESFWANAG